MGQATTEGANDAKRRIEKLETTLAVCHVCGKPKDRTPRVYWLLPGQPRPPAGCPACERSVVIRVRPVRGGRLLKRSPPPGLDPAEASTEQI